MHFDYKLHCIECIAPEKNFLVVYIALGKSLENIFVEVLRLNGFRNRIVFVVCKFSAQKNKFSFSVKNIPYILSEIEFISENVYQIDYLALFFYTYFN